MAENLLFSFVSLTLSVPFGTVNLSGGAIGYSKQATAIAATEARFSILR
jgi:hypothetical protein